MSHTIEPAVNADRPGIEAVVRAGLHEFGFEFAPETSERDLGDIEATYHRRGGIFEVARDADGRIVGCYGVYPLDDAGNGKLRKMYVLRETRGSGLGTRLLRRGLDFARRSGFRTLWLETTPEMVVAQRLYERAGFQRIEACAAPESESPRCSRVYRFDFD